MLLSELLKGLCCPIHTWMVQAFHILFYCLFWKIRKKNFHFINHNCEASLATKYLLLCFLLIYCPVKMHSVSSVMWIKISVLYRIWIVDSTRLLKVLFSKVYDKHSEHSVLQKEILASHLMEGDLHFKKATSIRLRWQNLSGIILEIDTLLFK